MKRKTESTGEINGREGGINQRHSLTPEKYQKSDRGGPLLYSPRPLLLSLERVRESTMNDNIRKGNHLLGPRQTKFL